jgi:hypothetical protein
MVGQQTKLVDSHMYFLNKNTKKKINYPQFGIITHKKRPGKGSMTHIQVENPFITKA